MRIVASIAPRLHRDRGQPTRPNQDPAPASLVQGYACDTGAGERAEDPGALPVASNRPLLARKAAQRKALGQNVGGKIICPQVQYIN